MPEDFWRNVWKYWVYCQINWHKICQVFFVLFGKFLPPLEIVVLLLLLLLLAVVVVVKKYFLLTREYLFFTYQPRNIFFSTDRGILIFFYWLGNIYLLLRCLLRILILSIFKNPPFWGMGLYYIITWPPGQGFGNISQTVNYIIMKFSGIYHLTITHLLSLFWAR